MSSKPQPVSGQETSAMAESAAIKKIAKVCQMTEAAASDCVNGLPVLKKDGESVTVYEVHFLFEDDSQRVITVTIAYNQGHPYAKKVAG